MLLASFQSYSYNELSPLKFKTLSINEGLSQSYVYSITQDQQGFIWIATQDGLNRFDGSNFVHYRKNITNKGTIADNIVRKVFVDKNNNLWVGTQKGLSLYNPIKDNFRNFYAGDSQDSLRDNEIWDIYQDNKGKIWVSTKEGLHTYRPEKDSFTRVVFSSSHNDLLTEVRTIYQDDTDRFWFGTYENGIYIVEGDMSGVIPLQINQQKSLSEPISTLFDIKKIKDNYWLATNQGVYVIASNNNIVKHFHTESDLGSILSNEVRTIEVIDNSNIWFGTSKGLNRVNILTGTVDSNTKTAHSSSLSENWILEMFKDSTDTVWIGTYGSGINVINPQHAKFNHGLFSGELSKSVEAITETNDGSLWIATYDGILKLVQNDTITASATPISETATHLLPYGNNIIYRSNTNKLYQYSPKTSEIAEFKNWSQNSKHDARNQLNIIENTLWYIDSDGYLTAFNLQAESFNRYHPPQKEKLSSLGVESDSRVIVTTNSNKMLSFNLETKIFSHFYSQQQTKFTIGQTSNIAISKNWIWLGSDNQGIALINKRSKKLTVFNEGNGIYNNFIASILLDNSENAWVSTNNGIIAITPESKEVRQYSKDFLINDNEFLSQSGLRAKNNALYFGGLYGFHHFYPSEILTISQHISAPVLTDLLIANRKIKISQSDKPNSNNNVDEEFELTNHVNQTSNLQLKYGQSPFSIEFISPNAKLPEQLRYRYRLVGLESDWIDSGENNNRATYTNLSAGDYTFEVQAYDLYDTSLTQTKSLNITVLPPWWLSNIAIVIYSLMTMLVVAYFLQQMRHKRLYNLQIKLSEERLKLSLWGSGDEMWDWNIEKGKIYRSNIWGILEFPQDGLRNLTSGDTNIHEQDFDRVQEALKEHIGDKSDHFEIAYRVKDKNDSWIWVLDRGKVVDRDNRSRPTRMTGTLKDISQIKKAEERLKLFAKCIENISDAVVIYDRQFKTVDVNKAFQRITQKKRTEMLGTSLTFSQYPEAFTQNVKKHLITKGSWHGEIESIRGQGAAYLTDLNIDVIRDENQNISHFVGVFSDITKRKETEAELRKLANSDTLTGLPNRSYFQANQTRLVKNKVPHALLVFDLDNFKKINDSMGHQIGDILLCKVAERILTVGRKQDTVYRLGGDEFSIIIENTNDIHTITTIAKEILRTIAKPLKLKNQEVVLFSSIGIVLYPEDGITPHELLKNADTAMYHAKNSGGNRYQFFSDSMNKQAVKRLQIENLIRHGLKEDLFSVFYQPKIEIATGKIAGMEALVRFETPTKGIISPVVFIPVSEETGQIVDIGEVVLRKSCHATKKWVDAGLFEGRIAVNLSAVQFTQPNLVSVIANILKESRLPAKYLELEITEGTVMDSPQQAIDTMLQIRAMGIHLSLDDFGTGYSSLAYLKKFPLNTLKIDKAFVDDIEHSEQGRNMVATIVTIAHNLELQVVAEGVETDQQLNFLATLDCEQLQGYLYSKPLKESDFHKYLLSHHITDKSTSFS